MSFKRAIFPAAVLDATELTAALAGIGMNFAAEANYNTSIEDALFFASREGMENDDLRTLALLVAWLETHSRRINADRLWRIFSNRQSIRIRAFWSAVARWQQKDRRFLRLAKLYRGPRLDLLVTGTDFLIARHGEDARFRGGPLRVPANVIRHRPSDVLSPEELAKNHRVYRFRLMIGPTYRADMWAAIEDDSSISATELARRTYGSFATAWQVKHDWKILNA